VLAAAELAMVASVAKTASVQPPRTAAAQVGKIIGTLGQPNSSTAITEVPRMNSVIYLIGLVVVVLAILSFLGLS
jgi:hypothetical protein